MGDAKWWEAFAAGMAGVAAVIVPVLAFFRWYFPKRKQKKDVRLAYQGLKSLSETLNSMEHAVHRSKICDRAIILAAHNHGGLPSPSKPYFTSAIHWCASTDETSERVKKYQDIVVDAAYCEMILEVFEKGFVILDQETMKPGLLKNIYELERVGQSLIIRLGVRDQNMIYISYARLVSSGGFRAHEITELKLAAAEIARNML